MLKKIVVLLNDGSKVKVWAWCVGNLGINKTVEDYCGRQSMHAWTVTHIPTGMTFIGERFDRSGIHKLVRDIQGKSQWRNLDWVNDIPACELLDILPVIAKENGLGICRDWQKTREVAVKAIGC